MQNMPTQHPGQFIQSARGVLPTSSVSSLPPYASSISTSTPPPTKHRTVERPLHTPGMLTTSNGVPVVPGSWSEYVAAQAQAAQAATATTATTGSKSFAPGSLSSTAPLPVGSAAYYAKHPHPPPPSNYTQPITHDSAASSTRTPPAKTGPVPIAPYPPPSFSTSSSAGPYQYSNQFSNQPQMPNLTSTVDSNDKPFHLATNRPSKKSRSRPLPNAALLNQSSTQPMPQTSVQRPNQVVNPGMSMSSNQRSSPSPTAASHSTTQSTSQAVAKPLPPLVQYDPGLLIYGLDKSERNEVYAVMMNYSIYEFEWASLVAKSTANIPEDVFVQYCKLLIKNAGLIADIYAKAGGERVVLPDMLDGVPRDGLGIDLFNRMKFFLGVNRLLPLQSRPRPGPIIRDGGKSGYEKIYSRESVQWRPEDDLNLLKGVARHGYSQISNIISDSRLFWMGTMNNTLNCIFNRICSPKFEPHSKDDVKYHKEKLKFIETFLRDRLYTLEKAMLYDTELTDSNPPAASGNGSTGRIKPAAPSSTAAAPESQLSSVKTDSGKSRKLSMKELARQKANQRKNQSSGSEDDSDDEDDEPDNDANVLDLTTFENSTPLRIESSPDMLPEGLEHLLEEGDAASNGRSVKKDVTLKNKQLYTQDLFAVSKFPSKQEILDAIRLRSSYLFSSEAATEAYANEILEPVDTYLKNYRAQLIRHWKSNFCLVYSIPQVPAVSCTQKAYAEWRNSPEVRAVLDKDDYVLTASDQESGQSLWSRFVSMNCRVPTLPSVQVPRPTPSDTALMRLVVDDLSRGTRASKNQVTDQESARNKYQKFLAEESLKTYDVLIQPSPRSSLSVKR
eukprot:GILJ01012320.1.p1 GENE.GILJ01012320.1~~GILJ01012320.1.p1  ORF type:complete len:946 (+),score=183.53 GILJ01012320.1:314-2839(+)